MTLLIQYTLIFASVLLLVALGGCVSEHSGVINLGLEGIMVIGAVGGALTMRALGTSVPAAVMIIVVIVVAIICGILYSALLGVACINFKADQTIIGTALNMLGVAGATVLVKAINTAANPNDVSSEIQYVDTLLHAKKNLLKAEEMSEAMDGGYSMRGEGNSYARGRGRNAKRDSMGRYSRERGGNYSRERGYSRNYSMDGEDMVEELRTMMENAPDERTRMEFEKMISKMER